MFYFVKGHVRQIDYSTQHKYEKIEEKKSTATQTNTKIKMEKTFCAVHGNDVIMQLHFVFGALRRQSLFSSPYLPIQITPH